MRRPTEYGEGGKSCLELGAEAVKTVLMDHKWNTNCAGSSGRRERRTTAQHEFSVLYTQEVARYTNSLGRSYSQRHEHSHHRLCYCILDPVDDGRLILALVHPDIIGIVNHQDMTVMSCCAVARDSPLSPFSRSTSFSSLEAVTRYEGCGWQGNQRVGMLWKVKLPN